MRMKIVKLISRHSHIISRMSFPRYAGYNIPLIKMQKWGLYNQKTASWATWSREKWRLPRLLVFDGFHLLAKIIYSGFKLDMHVFKFHDFTTFSFKH